MVPSSQRDATRDHEALIVPFWQGLLYPERHGRQTGAESSFGALQPNVRPNIPQNRPWYSRKISEESLVNKGYRSIHVRLGHEAIGLKRASAVKRGVCALVSSRRPRPLRNVTGIIPLRSSITATRSDWKLKKFRLKDNVPSRVPMIDSHRTLITICRPIARSQ